MSRIQIRTRNMQAPTALRFAEAGAILFGGRNNNRRLSRNNQDEAAFNWGSHNETLGNVQTFNPPEAVALWSNKARVEQVANSEGSLFKRLFIPMTTDKAVAQGWLDGGNAVVVRNLVAASNGRGIEVVDPASEGEPPAQLPDAPLYTMYKKKRNEYRIHAGCIDGEGTIIAAQRKARRRDAQYGDQRIRNAHDTGTGSWVFLEQPINELPDVVAQVAIDFFETSQGDIPLLDYAGLDIGYNERYNTAFIIETNTAPGLGPNDVQAYLGFFSQLLGEEPVVTEAEATDWDLEETTGDYFPDDGLVSVTPSAPDAPAPAATFEASYEESAVVNVMSQEGNLYDWSLPDVATLGLEEVETRLANIVEVNRRLAVRTLALQSRRNILINEEMNINE